MAKKEGKRNQLALQEQQSEQATIGFLNNQWQDHPSIGLTPRRLYALLTEAEQGQLTAQSELFADMEERNGHIFSEISKRKRALLTLPFSVAAPPNASAAEKQMAADVGDWLNAIPNFEDVLFDALDAIGHGFSCQEIRWQLLDGLWLPSSINFVPQGHFVIDNRDPTNPIKIKSMQYQGDVMGDELWDFGWLTHIHKAKTGYLSRAGLYRVLTIPFMYMHYAGRDLAEFLEIYGLPLRLGKYPSAATEQEKSTLLRAVMSIGHNAGGIIPQGMAIDFEAAASGSADNHLAMIRWCEQTISKAILGGTLTSQADGKSSTNALGNVHNEVRHELLVADAKQLASSINSQLIGYLMRLNKPNVDPSRYPKLQFDVTEPEDIAVFAEALPKLVEIGVQIPVDWVHTKLGIPLPEPDAAVLKRQPIQQEFLNHQVADTNTAANAKAANAKAANAKPVQQTNSTSAETQAITAQLQLEQAMQALLNDETLQQTAVDLVMPLLSQINQADGLQDAIARLHALEPRLNTNDIQDTLTQYGFAATAFGAQEGQ